jgi:hypothetical protein
MLIYTPDLRPIVHHVPPFPSIQWQLAWCDNVRDTTPPMLCNCLNYAHGFNPPLFCTVCKH